MQEIHKIQDENVLGLIKICTDEGIFDITIKRNQDIYWSYWTETDKKEKTFYITKENEFLYTRFCMLYNAIKNERPYSNYPDEWDGKTRKFYNESRWEELFNDNKIIWYSDEEPIEYASSVAIEKEKEQFKITFTKSKTNSEDTFRGENFAVCFKNGVSRYKPYNCPFINIYNDIWQNYVEPNVEDEKCIEVESGPKKSLTIDSKKNNSHMDI